jgi:uncharacterized protein (TIGR02145 family)
MKTKIRIWFCHLSVMGLVLILASNCKDDLNDTLIVIDQDQDSISYSSVNIGTQEWMTYNLKVRRYQNVEKILTTTPVSLNLTAEHAPKYHWAYDGDEKNVDTYGRLYTWYAVTDPRKLCPRGWHVPSDEEWTNLISLEAMGGEDVGGGKLKETGTMHWSEPNTGATNETGFTALPGGYRFHYGRFRDAGFNGFWWSSTESSDSTAYGWGMTSSSGRLSRFNFDKRDGLAVRCILGN